MFGCQQSIHMRGRQVRSRLQFNFRGRGSPQSSWQILSAGADACLREEVENPFFGDGVWGGGDEMGGT